MSGAYPAMSWSRSFVWMASSWLSKNALTSDWVDPMCVSVRWTVLVSLVRRHRPSLCNATRRGGRGDADHLREGLAARGHPGRQRDRIPAMATVNDPAVIGARSDPSSDPSMRITHLLLSVQSV